MKTKPKTQPMPESMASEIKLAAQYFLGCEKLQRTQRFFDNADFSMIGIRKIPDGYRLKVTIEFVNIIQE